MIQHFLSRPTPSLRVGLIVEDAEGVLWRIASSSELDLDGSTARQILRDQGWLLFYLSRAA